GTATGGLFTGGDYPLFDATTFLFEDGEATTTAFIDTRPDTLLEGPEILTLTIQPSPGSYTIGTATMAALLVDDDGPLATPVADVCLDDLTDQTPAATMAGPAKLFGVRAADGVVTVTGVDLSSAGFGQAWGLTRGWTNAYGYDANAADGNGTITSQMPYLQTDGTDVVAVTGAGAAEYFDGSGGSYAARAYSQDTLVEDTGTKEFTLVTSGGTKVVFHNFDSSFATPKKGQLKSVTDPDGNVTTVTSLTVSGQPQEVQRSVTVGGVTTTESYLYAVPLPKMLAV
ncbi:MAG TPA: hypothetical protein VM597_13580, partial [Gemmataceae bacterium]|nr:hypothetical protein [Gemmataceae bacterium]